MADSQRLVSTSELTKHTKPDDLWIVVNGKVFDMTRFAPEHPGGPDSMYPLRPPSEPYTYRSQLYGNMQDSTQLRNIPKFISQTS